MRITLLLILLCLLSGCENSGLTVEQPDDPTLTSEEPSGLNDLISDDNEERVDYEPESIGGAEFSSPEDTTNSNFPQPATLIAQRQSTQINLAAQPSHQAKSKGYGLPGDSVDVINSATGDDGNRWYKVRFDVSEAEGWIENRYIQIGEVNTAVSENSQNDKISAANISPQEAQQMIAYDQNNNYDNVAFKVIIPTYVPSGFRSIVNVEDEGGPSYSLFYIDNSNNCFEISALTTGFGSGAVDYSTRIVKSKALGNVELGYIQFDGITNQPSIGFDAGTVKGTIPSKQEYSFDSPTRRDGCNTIDFEEAVKIVQSLEYLNP